MKYSKQSKFAPLLATTMLVAAGGYMASAAPLSQTEDQTGIVQPRQVKRVVNRELGLTELKEQADLVFYGEVVDLQNVMSEHAGANQPSLPFTFVTYRVDSVVKGSYAGKYATLRFIGGYDPVRGAHLRSSNSPMIDLGDKDILFVEGNQRKITPLVKDEQGRLRVIDGRVYTELGHEVVETAPGKIEYGARFDLDEVRTTTAITGEVQRIDLGQVKTGPSNAMFVNDLLGTIAGLPTSQMVSKTAFASADAKLPFLAPDFSPAGPPADNGVAAAPMTAEELAERAALPQSKPAPQRKPGKRRPTRQVQKPDQAGN